MQQYTQRTYTTVNTNKYNNVIVHTNKINETNTKSVKKNKCKNNTTVYTNEQNAKHKHSHKKMQQ